MQEIALLRCSAVRLGATNLVLDVQVCRLRYHSSKMITRTCFQFAELFNSKME